MLIRYDRPDKPRLLLLLPVILYLTLCVLYLFAIPPGESPDEPSHLQCIEQVSILQRIPLVDPPPRGLWWTRERVISGLTCYHLPLYYLIAGNIQRIAGHLTGAPLHYEFPPTDSRFATGASVAMFVHARKAHFLALREPITLTILRVGSILLGLGMLWTAYQLVRRLAPDQPYAPALAMTIMAGWPQFVFMSRAINNDALAIPLAVMALGVLAKDDRPRRYIWASALMAGAILSKLTMAFALLVAAVSWGIEWLNASSTERRHALLSAGGASLLICVALVALLVGQPTLRDHVRATISVIAPANPNAYTMAYWGNVARTTLQSGWGRFGWMNLATPDAQVYAWWSFLAITISVGFVSVLRCSWKTFGQQVLLLCLFWAAGTLAIYGQIQVNRFQPQFRYAFALLPVLAAFSGIGISALGGGSARRQRMALLALLALLLIVNLWIVFAVLAPVYP